MRERRLIPPLCAAALEGHAACVLLLLEQGASLDATGPRGGVEGLTALHFAVLGGLAGWGQKAGDSGSFGCISALLERDADVNATDGAGVSTAPRVLACCVARGHHTLS